MKCEVGDRVRHYNGTETGTVKKIVGAQGKYHAVAVVEWDDDDSRGTIRQADLVPADESSAGYN